MASGLIQIEKSRQLSNYNNLWYLKLYKKSQGALSRLVLFFEACLNGFWLGVLNYESFQKIDEIYYSDNKMYYSSDFNKQGLRRWEQKVVNEYFVSRPDLLLIAAGGGREAYRLLKMGFKVDAYECHAGLAKFANELLLKEGFTSCVSVAPRDHCPTGDKTYDASIVGWGAYMHIQGRERRITFLREIHKQLNVDSPLLISFWSRPSDSRRHKLIAYIANTIRFFLRKKRLETGDDINLNFVHYFTQQEIRSEMKEAGFDTIFYASKPYGHAVGAALDVN